MTNLPASIRTASTTSGGLTLRPATAGDAPFLFRLYLETQGAELAHAPLPEAHRQALLASQFKAREQHYRERFPGAQCQIVELGGEPIGRQLVAQTDAQVLVIDIGLVPAHRGRGIGTALLRSLLAEAAGRASSVALRVRHENPARRLYERLGFAIVDQDELLVTMLWVPATDGGSPHREIAHENAA